MSSNNNYYEFKDAKVAIAMELVKRGWKLYGFHEDESDWMTDYWSPAWWEGVATKDGFVVVVDCRWNDKSGKEIIQHIYNSEEVILSAKTRSLIERLSEVRQDRGASAAEEQTAKAKIEKLRAKANSQTEKIKVTDRYPEYQPNPPRMSWHVEKDGVIIAKGNGVAKFSDMKYFDKEGYEKDLKECDKNSYRYEKAEKLLKLAKQFEKFMNKIDSAAGCMIGGNGKAYVYTNVETGEKYYIAYRLDKKLKKQLTGNANPANCFGYISGSYKERFLKWIETGALAWCEIQEVKTPYKVQKCVKKKIG